MTTKTKPKGYSIIQHSLMGDTNIPLTARCIYAFILGVSKNDGYAQVSDQYLADLIGTTKNTAVRLIKELDDKGYIRRQTVHIGMKSIRKIYPLKQF
jgi:SOS-response transcriptional repressor LexA